MIRISFLFLFGLSISAVTNAIDITKVVRLKDQQEIGSAVKIKDKMDEIQSNIKLCADKGGAHDSCLCDNKELILQQATLIKEALRDHPSWLEIGWFKFSYRDAGDINFNAKGLQRQSEMQLDCI